MDYFVNRIIEFGGFKKALDALFDDEIMPPVLLYHGDSGIGKTCLLQQCNHILKNHPEKPIIIYQDSIYSNMTLDMLYTNIQKALEAEYGNYFKDYDNLLSKINQIQHQVEQKIIAKPEYVQQIIKTTLVAANHTIVKNVPNGIANLNVEIQQNPKVDDKLTTLRQNFASIKLDIDDYKFFLKDLQAEQCKLFANTLNKIASENNRKMVILIDQFEKLALTPNVLSDKTFYEYWRDYFLKNLSSNILLIQAGKLNIADDYYNHLGDGNVLSFELKPFDERDILKILSYAEMNSLKMEEYKNFVELLIEKTQGYPIALGLLREHLQQLTSTEELEQIKQEILQDNNLIIERSIEWSLNNYFDPKLKDLLCKIAICCSNSEKIDRTAVEFLFNISFQKIGSIIEKLSEQSNFIDCTNWYMHELVRKSILRHLKSNNDKLLRSMNADLSRFYQAKAEKEFTEKNNEAGWYEYILRQLYHTYGYSEEDGIKLLLNLIFQLYYTRPCLIENLLNSVNEIRREGIYEITELSHDWIEFWHNYMNSDGTDYSSPRERFYWLKNQRVLLANNMGELCCHLGLIENKLKNYKKSAQLFEESLGFFPNRSWVWNILGQIYTELGQLEEAIISYRKAIKLDPDDPTPHNELGKLYEKLSRQEDAVGEFQQAAAHNMEDPTPFINLGKFYTKAGSIEEAINAYQKAIVLDPSNAIVHNNLGTLYDKLNQQTEAIKEYQKAIEFDPNYAIPHCNLGNLYADSGRTEEAKAAYHKAIDLNPNFAYAHNNLGRIYDELGQKEQAIEQYTKAAELAPDYAAPHNNLGTIYNDLGQNEDAITEYQKAIELDPDDPAPHYNLGKIYYGLNRKQEAIAEYEKASELDPEDAAIFYTLGKIYFKLDRKEESMEAYHKAFELSKNENSS